MSDFNKPKIIQPEDTGPAKPAEPQINQKVEINIQQPPIAGEHENEENVESVEKLANVDNYILNF